MSSIDSTARWAWLVNRLRCMTPAEVVHRAAVSSKAIFWRWRGRPLPTLELPNLGVPQTPWLGVPKGASGAPFAAEVGHIAEGQVRLFAGTRFRVGHPPHWNRCPLTGTVSPALPSDQISLTDRAQVGDIKFVWELNRHLHWVSVAQAYATTGDSTHLHVLRVQLESWLDQCPAFVGPNWTSALELGLRLINWSVVWQLIGGKESALFQIQGAEGAKLRVRWLESVQLHVLSIAGRYSRHSSANNHLIGELAGVFAAACTWPYWVRGRRLGALARAELEREIQLQVSREGVLREQAFEYATFCSDFFAVTERVAAAEGTPMSAVFVDRMAAMCCFLRSVMAVGGAVPHVGDADGARVLRLHPEGERTGFAAMLQKGARLFGRPDWVYDLGEIGRAEARWMYAGLEQPAVRTQRQLSLVYKDGGYELFDACVNMPGEVKGFVDVGPLGYLGIAAHGHADALQVCLTLGGQPLLVDPGTYSYWVEKNWRDYFRGTSAHNTVRIGQQDQSVSGGRFMWTRKAQVLDLNVRRYDNGAMRLSARHDGYSRLASGFKHGREVVFEPTARSLQVDDKLTGTAPEMIELHWHIHPSWKVALEGHVLTLKNGAREAVLEVSVRSELVDGERLELIYGQTNPPLGWYSEAYNEKQPSPVLRWAGIASTIELRTMVRW